MDQAAALAGTRTRRYDHGNEALKRFAAIPAGRGSWKRIRRMATRSIPANTSGATFTDFLNQDPPLPRGIPLPFLCISLRPRKRAAEPRAVKDSTVLPLDSLHLRCSLCLEFIPVLERPPALPPLGLSASTSLRPSLKFLRILYNTMNSIRPLCP